MFFIAWLCTIPYQESFHPVLLHFLPLIKQYKKKLSLYLDSKVKKALKSSILPPLSSDHMSTLEILMTRTLQNSNLGLTRTKNQFLLNFCHTFQCNLPSLTQTLHDSKLPQLKEVFFISLPITLSIILP